MQQILYKDVNIPRIERLALNALVEQLFLAPALSISMISDLPRDNMVHGSDALNSYEARYRYISN